MCAHSCLLPREGPPSPTLSIESKYQVTEPPHVEDGGGSLIFMSSKSYRTEPFCDEMNI